MGRESVPIAKANVYNTALPAAEADFLASELVPTSEPSYFTIVISLAIAGVLRVARTVGATTTTQNLNSGTALIANAEYAFSFGVNEDETINFRYSTTGGNILSMKVDESGVL